MCQREEDSLPHTVTRPITRGEAVIGTLRITKDENNQYSVNSPAFQIPCNHCNSWFSLFNGNCPHCGHPAIQTVQALYEKFEKEDIHREFEEYKARKRAEEEQRRLATERELERKRQEEEARINALRTEILKEAKIREWVQNDIAQDSHWFSQYIKDHWKYCEKASCKYNDTCLSCDVFQDDFGYEWGTHESVDPYDFTDEEEYLRAVRFAEDSDYFANSDIDGVSHCHGLDDVWYASRFVDPRDFEDEESFLRETEAKLFDEIVNEFPFIQGTDAWRAVFLSELKATGSLRSAKRQLLSIWAEENEGADDCFFDEATYRCQLSEPHETDHLLYDDIDIYDYEESGRGWDDLSRCAYVPEQLYRIIIRMKPGLEPLIQSIANADLIGIDLPKDYAYFFPLVLTSSLFFYETLGFELEDSIQNGQIGLLKALKGRGFAFYDYYWFEDFVRETIDAYIIRYSSQAQLLWGEELSVGTAKQILEVLRKYGGNWEEGSKQIEKKRSSWERRGLIDSYIQYLFLPEKDEIHVAGCSASDMMANDEFEQEMHAIDMRVLKSKMEAIFESLTPREEKIMRLRWGFDDGRVRTLEEVGRALNLTRERVRQIETKVLKQLKTQVRTTMNGGAL